MYGIYTFFSFMVEDLIFCVTECCVWCKYFMWFGVEYDDNYYAGDEVVNVLCYILMTTGL